jgi:HAMP domain-containing protein
LTLVGAVLLGTLGVASYRLSKAQAIDEAKSKAKLVAEYMASTRNYLVLVQRPLLKEILESDRFYPELLSGAAVVRGVSERFTSTYPDYLFKQTSLDPFVPENRATDSEREIIEVFRKNKTRRTIEGVTKLRGKTAFFQATRMQLKKKCLRCHGDPAKAPKDIVEIYGTESGFGKKAPDVAGALMVYVPLESALEAARGSAVRISAIGGGLVLVVVLLFWAYLGRSVFRPVEKLTDRVEKLSLGESIEDPMAVDRHDEIGALSKAVERLRVSVVKLIGSDDDD